MKIQKVLELETGYLLNDQFYIPFDKDNEYSKQIKNWEKQGNKIEKFSRPEVNIIRDKKHSLISALKQNRDKLLNHSQTYSIISEGVEHKFRLSNLDLPNLIARCESLTTTSATLGWSDIENNRVMLNREAFRGLVRHINANDETVWSIYAQKIEEINSISVEGKYTDDHGEPITALQKLESVNINFK